MRHIFFAAAIAAVFFAGLLGAAFASFQAAKNHDDARLRVWTAAGTGKKGYADGPAKSARFNWPTGVAAAPDGGIYVADYFNSVIRKITPSGKVIRFAGSGNASLKDGVGADANFHGPDNIASDKDGNVYVADADNFVIRKITPDGAVTTIAGNGISGYRDGAAKDAMFAYPTGVDIAPDGTLYVADRRSNTVRRITPAGEVSTVVGNGLPGFADGKGLKSNLREPLSVAVGKDGTVYVADSGNNAIRKITADGAIVTIAGGRVAGYRDGIVGEALFSWPSGIAVAPDGSLYICDSNNNKIRRMTGEKYVSTVAGTLSSGFYDGLAPEAEFSFPTGIMVSPSGDIYVADSGNNAIRVVGPASKAEAGRRGK